MKKITLKFFWNLSYLQVLIQVFELEISKSNAKGFTRIELYSKKARRTQALASSVINT